MEMSGQLVLTYRAEQRLNITSIHISQGAGEGTEEACGKVDALQEQTE